MLTIKQKEYKTMWATIVAAILGITGTAISAGVSNKNQREAKEESKELALIARDDEQQKQFKDYKANLEGIQISKDTLALKNRGMNATLKFNNKINRQNQIANLSSALKLNSKSDQNMTNFIMSLYGKTGAA